MILLFSYISFKAEVDEKKSKLNCTGTVLFGRTGTVSKMLLLLPFKN